MALKYRLASRWVLAVPLALSVAYALYARAQPSLDGTAATASELFLQLAADPRPHLFVGLPCWLIGSGIVLARSMSPQRLGRYGSWRRAGIRPLWKCLRLSAGMSLAAGALWLVALGGTYTRTDTAGTLATSVGVFLLAVAMVLVAQACVYLLMAAGYLATGSKTALALIPAALGVWVALSNAGLFTAPLLDGSSYFSIGAAFATPAVFAMLAVALAATSSAVWLAADYKDNLATLGNQEKRPFALVVPVAVFGLVVLGAAGPRPSGVTAVRDVFYGTGGTLTQYLLGIAIVLLISLPGTLTFAAEWHSRSAQLIIRHGSVNRWLVSTLGRDLRTVCGYIAAVLACAVGTRAATDGVRGTDWFLLVTDTGTAFVKLVLAVAFCLTVAMVATTQMRSSAAGATVGAVVLGLGMLPFNTSPLYPLTAWSMSWSGRDNLLAVLSLGLCAVIAAAVLLAANSTRNGSNDPTRS